MNLTFSKFHSAHQFEDNLNGYIGKHHIEFLAYTNAKLKYVKVLEHFRGFHVIRDPRDIVVSAYFSHQYSHPTNEWPALIHHKKQLQNVSQEEGLLLEMQFSKDVFDDLYQWDYSQPQVMELKMEELIAEPYETLIKACSFLGIVDNRHGAKPLLYHAFMNKLHRITRGMIPAGRASKKLSVLELLSIIYRNRFSQKATGRKQGEENARSHYRKGIAGDWLNYFSGEHRDYFKKEYNDLLLKLGYETTSDW
jgi:hypothetical protein